ncbi:urea transporter [Allochromatium palmeri]|uniref:Peptidoglycan DD-metalloendopeptidase family protein n=1 Tax=Allochromatium palmeri TaxID=231048 RepID=A0A6N8EFW8_9GAMM|nr:urea transporter [Allochromatium palmeri]MTW21556.1 peptidoglycan DD-metalloendopeptidase family protein [Allochromatium palmeri]
MARLSAPRGVAKRLLIAYGALFLAPGPVAGALVLAATLIVPGVGLLGLTAGLAALGTRALLRLPALAGEAEVLNAIYVGLVLGALHGGDGRLLVLAALGGALVVVLASALEPLLRQTRELPLLGAPFLCAAWTLLPAAKALDIPMQTWDLAVSAPDWLGTPLATALSTLGALFYVPNPVSGMLVLAAVLLVSPVLGVLALAGGGLAWGLVAVAGDATGGTLPMLAAFNGALTALILGSQTHLGRRGLAVTAGGVVAATAFSAALLWTLWPLGLPPLSAPFLLATWLMSAALRPERSAFWARQWLPFPARPEEGLSLRRLQQARGVDPASVALRPPFVGRMEVSQSMDGAHTHRGPWRYALDFVRTERGLSFRGQGAALTDYYAFDLPVVSPAWGTVLACRNDVPDHAPGEINVRDNWGNHVLIGIGGGDCVLLAHLRQGSVLVLPGQPVMPGVPVARLGNSGRSTQPHLHLHVQRGDWLGAPTRPFHLAGFVGDDGRLVLDGNPMQGTAVTNPTPNAGLTQALRLAPGRQWRFAVPGGDWTLTVKVGLYGETELVSNRGGRILASHNDLLFSLYQRGGATDPTLDAFVLAFGLTPLIEQGHGWDDAPSAGVLGLGVRDRLRVRLGSPLGGNLVSHYERHWDGKLGLWVQRGQHRLAALGGAIRAESVGLLSETEGPVGFRLAVPGREDIGAGLVGVGNQGDHGIPAWSADLIPATTRLQTTP